MPDWHSELKRVLQPAVGNSATLRELIVESGALAQAGRAVRRWFDGDRVVVFADEAGFAAAGNQLVQSLVAVGLEVSRHVIAADPLPKPSVELAETFRARIAPGAVPLSLGSGVINDLVKYAAFQADRPYMSVATAASMDGYASAGAPLSRDGFKMTIPARAPRVIVADLDVIAAAPPEMNSWGYADLAGKVAAGGDWIVADALGIEAIDDVAWPLVQDNLAGWLADPAGIAGGGIAATARLFGGLTLVGLAMEFHGSSRPASGADHQIAHLWEMQQLAHAGRPVSHGACVAIGCVTMLGLFDWLLDQDLSRLNPRAIARAAPDPGQQRARIEAAFDDPRIAARARQETAAKHTTGKALVQRLERLTDIWPHLRGRLRSHLMRKPEMVALLQAAGAPSAAGDIGVNTGYLRQTVLAARFLRSRYTLLDLLDEAGLLERAVAETIGGRPSQRR